MMQSLVGLTFVFALLGAVSVAAADADGGRWVTDAENGCRLWYAGTAAEETPVTVTWSGTCREGHASGFGTAEWRIDGGHPNTCQCEFSEGKAHGYGEHRWPDGGSYIGSFENGLYHGVGRLTYPDWERYDGDFRNGLRHGQGVLVLPDRTEIEGVWEEDVMVRQISR